METNPRHILRFQQLTELQKRNPHLFTPDQVDEMQELSSQLGVDWKPHFSETSFNKIINQASSGFLEGFTTISTGEAPRNTYEAIAHSLGHLAGFVSIYIYRGKTLDG